MRKVLWAGVLAAALAPVAVQGQGRGLAAACGQADDVVYHTCNVAAQAVEAAQPQVGLLITGGNPTLGTASTGGLRLGVLPRVSATAKVNLVFASVPDLREVRVAPNDAISYDEMTIVAPALSGTVTVGLLPGVTVAPTVGGIGAVDLLASAAWVPLRALGDDGFRSASADVAWGGGVRVGLLRESFTMPGLSLSAMYHRLGTVQWGRICPARIATSTNSGPGYTLEEGLCFDEAATSPDAGDLGEFAFDLSSWSTRAAASKHLLGLGLSAGVGYDRFSSDLGIGVRGNRSFEVIPANAYARITDAELSQGRWSAFVDGSFSVLVATFAVEAGWMQGGDAISGYPSESSDFDPGEGTFFGSIGVRVAL